MKMSDVQNRKDDGKRHVGPPPGFAVRFKEVKSQAHGNLQVSYTPVYVTTSTPKSVDLNNSRNIVSKASGVLLNNILPSPITKCNNKKNAVVNSKQPINKSLLLGPLCLQKTQGYTFTGNEKPFVPRAKTGPVSDSDAVKNPRQSAPNPTKTPGNEIPRTPNKGKRDMTLSPLNPLQFGPLVQNTVPALEPISPIRQMQMELQAGMRPSLPPALTFTQRPSQVITKSAGCNMKNSSEARPILGRKFNDQVQIKAMTSAGVNHSTRGAIQPAHSNYKLSSLAAQDSAIILTPSSMEPIDLSRKSPNDYARVWNQMTVKPIGNDGSSIKTSVNQHPFSGNENPFCPSSGAAGSKSMSLPGQLISAAHKFRDCANKSDDRRPVGGPVEKMNQPFQECKVDMQTISRRQDGNMSQVQQTPSEEAIPKSVSESEFGSETRLLIAENNSSSSTLPYEDDTVEPLNLSRVEAVDLKQSNSADSSSSSGTDRDDSHDTIQTPGDFLGVRGHAIEVKREDPVSYPLEISEGLMDSVFEEDMIKGDSNLVSPQNSAETEEQVNSPLRLCGNNVWERRNLNEADAVFHSDNDSYVSDSEEEGYLTCTTSVGYEAALDSPIIDVLGRNDSGRGYSVYNKSDTPTKVLKWLEHSSDDLHKSVLSELVSAVQKGQSSTDDSEDVNNPFRRIVLKGIQHMLISSNKLEEIVTFDIGGSNIKTSQLVSVVKAYINATTRCINKIAQIMKNEPKKSTKKSRAKKGTSITKSGKKLQAKAKASRSQNFAKKLIKSDSREQHAEGSTGTKTSDICPEEHSKYRVTPLIGAVDFVTSTPITGNRYWKKRMLRQNLREESASNVTKEPNQSIPERRALLSASYSDDDDDETTTPVPKLAWTHCRKFQYSGLKLLGSDKKNRNKDEKMYQYKKLKNPTQRGIKGKTKDLPNKRKRSKGSPTGISPPNKNGHQKKCISTDEAAAHISSSHRRHFPYQMQCGRVIDRVYNLPESYPFREEFRNNEEPDYYKVIKYPMFFELVTSKLRQRLYYRLEDFVSDVRRVFWNTRHFYKDYRGETIESSRTLQYCDHVEDFFENKLKSTFPFMNFSDITGSPQAEKIKLKSSHSTDSTELDVFHGQKIKGALRELWK